MIGQLDIQCSTCHGALALCLAISLAVTRPPALAARATCSGIRILRPAQEQQLLPALQSVLVTLRGGSAGPCARAAPQRLLVQQGQGSWAVLRCGLLSCFQIYFIDIISTVELLLRHCCELSLRLRPV